MKKSEFFLPQKPADDYEYKRVLTFTNTIILVTICLISAMSILKILLYRHLDLSNYIMWSIAGIFVISYAVSKMGKVKLAGLLYLSTFWLAMTLLAWTSEGTRDSAVIAYIVCILISVHINRTWQSVMISLLSVISLWLLTYAEYNQIISPKPDTTLNYCIDLTVIMGVVITLIYLNARSYKDYYSRIEKEFNERINIERKLQNREAYYKTIFENSNDAIFIMKGNKFLECNSKTLELFNCTREQIINQSPVDFSPLYQDNGTSSQEKATQLIILALQGSPQRFEWHHCRFDKSPFDAEVSLNRIEINNEFLLLAIVRDISQRKQTEKILQYERALFRTIIDNIPDPIYAKDINAQKTVANLADVRNIGASSESEVLHKNDFELFPKEIAEKFYAVDQYVLKSGKPAINVEDYFSNESGKKIWYLSSKIPFFNDEGKLIGLVGIARDITERKEAEEAIKRSEERTRLILENMPILLNAFDGAGKFIVWNKACEQVTGYKAEDVIGHPNPMELFYPDPEYRKSVWEASLNKENRNNVFRLVKKNGEEKLIEWFDIYHHLAIPGWASWGMGIDITERIKAEESLKMQFRLQSLLMNMSATFINMPLENIESGIHSSLEELGEFVGADRVRIWEYDFPKQIADLTYEWCREEVDSKISSYQAVPFTTLPDFDVEMHRRGEIISLPDVSSIPAGRTRDFLEGERTRSLLTVPLMSLGKCIGFVGLNWIRHLHSYSDEELRILNFFALMMVNIWHRRHSEEVLMQTKARLNRGESVAKFGNWELNIDTSTFEVSEGAMKLYGAKESILSLAEVRKFILPEYHPLQDQAYRNLVEKGEPYDMEFKVINGFTGELVDIHSIAEYDPKRKIIFGTIQDITDRKHAENALRESESRLRAIFESSRDAIGVSKKGVHIYANPSYLKLFGFESNEEIFGTSIIESVALSHRQEMLLTVQRRSAKEPVPTFYESRGLKLDGTEFDAEFSISTYELHGEIYSVATIRDITERKQIQQELLKNEQRYRELADSIPIGIFETDTEGQITFANKAALDWFGYDLNSIQSGFKIRDFIVAQDHQRMMENFSKIISEITYKTSSSEYTAQKHDGQTFPVIISSFPISKNNMIIGIRGVVIDITQRKLAEIALQESEIKYRSLFESVPIGLYRTTIDGKILDFNRAAMKMLGYENPEEVIEHNATDLWVNPQLRLQMLSKFSEEEIFAFEMQMYTRDRRTIWIQNKVQAAKDEQGHLIHIEGSLEDITKRRQSEEELRKLFRAIEQSPVSIIITDSEGTIDYANPHFTKITGYTLEEVKGQNPRILKSGHTSDAEYKEMWTKISSGGDWKGELYNKKKNGEFYWEAASISPVINNMGIITNYIAVKEDITEKKETDRRILHAIIEAEERERNRFSRELHDGLGPIMSTVKIYFQWLAENDDLKKKTGIVAKGNRSIDDAIQSLREISNNLSPRVLGSLGIVSALKNFINLLNETGKLFVDFSYNTDRRYEKNLEITLYRVITELINNTVKYANTSHAEVKLNYEDEPSVINVEYKDSGKGFDLNKVMNSRKGLGLVNIQQRINTLNGKLIMNTSPRNGVNVHIELPLKA